MHRLVIEPDLLRDLIEVCRERGITITALLYAALASAVTQTYGGHRPALLVGSIAVSQRAPLPNDIIGNYAAGFTRPLPRPFRLDAIDEPTMSDIFALASSLTTFMRKPGMRERALQTVGLLAYIPKRERAPDSAFKYDTGYEQLLRRMGQAGDRRGSFGISNLGVWAPSAESTRFKITELHLSQSHGSINELYVRIK